MSEGKPCDVKTLNYAQLLKQNSQNADKFVGEYSNWFTESQYKLTKDTYVWVDLKGTYPYPYPLKTKDKQAKITVVGENTTFTIEFKSWKEFKQTEKPANFVTKITKQPTRKINENDVNNSKYCLIQLPTDISFYGKHEDENILLLPGNKDSDSDLKWHIEIDGKMLGGEKGNPAEIYDIKDQSKVAGKLDKNYFDSQHDLIQTVQGIKNRQGKWVKLVAKIPPTNCQINSIALKNSGDLVLDWWPTNNNKPPNHLMNKKN